MEPLVSAIITTCNRPQQLKTAVESVLADEYPHKEIIVIDDCSDMTLDFLDNDFTSVRVFRTEKSSGVAFSRNLGITKSSGEYITFLDDDDISYPAKISALTNLALTSGSGFVFGRTVKTFSEGTDQKVLIPEENFCGNGDYSWPPVQDFLLRMPSHNNAVLLRKEAILKVGGYSEDVFYFDDWAGWLKMFASGIKPVFLPLNIAEFRYHRGGLSDHVNSNGKLQHYIQKLLEKAIHYFSGNWPMKRILYALLSEIRHRTFRDYDEYVSYVLENKDRYVHSSTPWFFNTLNGVQTSLHEKLNISPSSIRSCMVDPPELEPNIALEINRVGICDQEFYLSLAGGDAVQKVLAKADVSVNLPAAYRGIHMSRIVNEIERLSQTVWLHPLDFLKTFADSLRQLQHGSRVYIDMTMHMPIEISLPESGRRMHQNFKVLCGIEDRLFYSGIMVPHMTACPCVQCYSACINEAGSTEVPARITHSQRAESTVIAWSRSKEALLDFDLPAICRQSLIIVCDMLRREDEFSIVYRAHAKPQFIEDCVRDLAHQFIIHPRYSSIEKLSISCRSYESIHSRDISARIELEPGKGTVAGS